MKSYKQKLAYIALGGVLMLTGMIASSVLIPSLFAQHDKDKFGEIECTGLTVVNEDGEGIVYIGLASHDRTERMGTIRVGDSVKIFGSEKGGTIEVTSIGYNAIFKDRVKIYGNTINLDNLGSSRVFTTLGSYGVETSDLGSNSAARFGIDEYGGYLQVKGRSKGYAIMGINEKGNGAMSTYDKNGYRQ